MRHKEKELGGAVFKCQPENWLPPIGQEDQNKINHVIRLHRAGKFSLDEISQMVGVSKYRISQILATVKSVCDDLPKPKTGRRPKVGRKPTRKKKE